MNPLSHWLSSNGLMPHGFCYQWKPALIWLHVASDILIALAYFSIPVVLIHLVRKRRDTPFSWMFVCFGVFIAACGATHVMEVWTLWIPSYWFSGGVKVITALASIPTAISLVHLVPQALSLSSPAEMRAANEELIRQGASLKKSEERFRQMAENIREIFWMLNSETKEVIYVSPAFEQICELALEWLSSNPKSYRDLIHAQDQQRVLAALEGLESTNRFDEEFRIVCPSGTVKWIRAIGFTAKDPAGNVTTLVGTAQEITARKEMEAVLQESEDRYRDLVEHSTDLICTHDLQGRLLTVNELPAKVLGYSQEELLNKPMRDFLLPEARAPFDESLLQIQKDGFVKGLMVVLTKTGEPRIWEYHNTLRTDGVTKPVVRGIAHDVTDQKRMEKALRLSEEKFSKAFLASPSAIVISTMEDGKLLDVNDGFVRVMGLSREESLGRTSSELGLWSCLNREDILNELKETGRVQSRQMTFQTRSGKPLDVNYSAELIEVGGRKCLLSVCEDITDRKRAEEARRSSVLEQRHIAAQLERERARLVEAQEVAKMGSWEAELQSLNVIWSEQTHRIFETDPSRFHATRPKFREFIHQEDREKVDAAFAKSLDKRSPCTVEYRIVMPDGRVKIIEERWQAFHDEEGKPVRVAGTCRDITERVRAEEELQRLSGQLLRLQDEERRRIARDLHDSTGQNVVALATTLSQLHASMPSSSRKLRKVVSQCQALADQCVCEVRTLSYLLHPPMLDEAGLEDAIRHYADGFAERTGIEVQLQVSPRFGRMTADVEMALFRVVQESLTNIQRHSGSLLAKIRIDRSAEKTTLEVCDKGSGIPGDQRKRNGDLPVRLGVGIASMHERVKLIGGHLDIESSSCGTTVRVTIPIHE